jgi:flavin reductase (DIM6/NTAB) family NADH-FMN oxidoreductase RutF
LRFTSSPVYCRVPNHLTDQSEYEVKREVPLSQAKWLVEPGCVVLVTSGTPEKANIMTFSWQTPLHSGEPCLLQLVINPSRYTYDLIQERRELVINVPGVELAPQVHVIGTTSGRRVDKFKKSGLTPVVSTLVAPPLIDEFAANLECRVIQIIDLQHHHLLVCQAVRAVAEDAYFDGRWNPERFHTLHYLGGNRYGVMDRMIEV